MQHRVSPDGTPVFSNRPTFTRYQPPPHAVHATRIFPVLLFVPIKRLFSLSTRPRARQPHCFLIDPQEIACTCVANCFATLSPVIAEIIAIGSELLTPFRQDTNSLYLTAQLNNFGVTVAFKSVVGDNRQHLTDVARIAVHRADTVIFMGGLGPTEDDLTRECVADALGRPLVRDPDIIAKLYARFAGRQIRMTPNNEKQADVIEGATALPNANGSAPGQWLVAEVAGEERIIVLLPGPPWELEALFQAEVLPRLRERVPLANLARRVLKVAMIGESTCDQRIAPVYKQFPDVQTTILAGPGDITLQL